MAGMGDFLAGVALALLLLWAIVELGKHFEVKK